MAWSNIAGVAGIAAKLHCPMGSALVVGPDRREAGTGPPAPYPNHLEYCSRRPRILASQRARPLLDSGSGYATCDFHFEAHVYRQAGSSISGSGAISFSLSRAEPDVVRWLLAQCGLSRHSRHSDRGQAKNESEITCGAVVARGATAW